MTGGIAEGKSTVMGYLRELGHETASADDEARQVFQYQAVQAQLGALLDVSGAITPEVLRSHIAKDSDVRRQVNRIMHPVITQRLMTSTAKWIEIPLLFETAMHSMFERVWVVTCGEEIQLQRLTERVGNVQVAHQLIATQLPTLVKCAFADEIVRTNGSEESVKGVVRSAIEREFSK